MTAPDTGIEIEVTLPGSTVVALTSRGLRAW
jgi:hypothetical protein